MAKKGKAPAGKRIEAHRHEEAKRRNIPTAEYQSVIQKEAEQPLRVAYERRNRDLDPQLVWRGKDTPRPSSTTCSARRASAATNPARRSPTSSPTSTASPRAWTRPSSTSTTRTGRTA